MKPGTIVRILSGPFTGQLARIIDLDRCDRRRPAFIATLLNCTYQHPVLLMAEDADAGFDQHLPLRHRPTAQAA